MKQLILTFFLVILCYSLFFDKKTGNRTKDEIYYIQEEAIIPYNPYLASDTVNYIPFFSSSKAMFSTWCVYGNISADCTLLTQ